jgi:hypothetical protein
MNLFKNRTKLFAKKYLVAYFILAGIGALGNLVYILLIPTDAKNGLVWGYSNARIGLAAGLFLIGLGCFIFGLRIYTQPSWERPDAKSRSDSPRINRMGLWLARTGLILTGFFFLIPVEYFGSWGAYVERLRPFAILGLQLSLQTIILFRFGRLGSSPAGISRNQAQLLRLTLIPFFIAGAMWMAITQFGLGIDRDRWTVWYEVGVPILGLQVGLAVFLAGLISWLAYLIRNQTRSFWVELIIGLGIWITAFSLWQAAPLPPSFFAPKPGLPSFGYYPFSDAASWDIQAQYALIGQGLNNQLASVDHSGYSGLLLIFHLLAGENFQQIVRYQVFLLSSLPVISYALGRHFHSRMLGLSLAAFAIFHELNAIASSNVLNLSNSKLLLTEFPTGVGLAGVALLLFMWLRQPAKGILFTLPLGGLFGFLIMIRYNVLAVYFAVIVGIFIVFGKNWRGGVKSVAILIIASGLTISPWLWRSWQISGNPIFFLPKVALLLDPSFRGVPTKPVMETGVPQVSNGPSESSNALSIPVSEPTSQPHGVVQRTLNHFAHSLITSVLILPTQPIFEYFPIAIQDGTFYKNSRYWSDTTDGWLTGLPPRDIFAIGLNLILLSVGLAKAFQKWHLAGLIPLGIYLAYNFATALARTSGGRYIVPIIWVILLYFGLGLVHVIWEFLKFMGFKPISENQFSSPTPLTFQAGLLWTIPFFIFIASLTVIERQIPPRYEELSPDEVLATIVQTDLLQNIPFQTAEIDAFLDQPAAHAYMGRGLYPRYYWARIGTGGRGYRSRPFSRLVLTTVGPNHLKQVFLPLLPSPADIFHGSDVLIVGCQGSSGDEIDALFIAVLGETHQVFTRVPKPEKIVCPLPPPFFPKSIGH